MKRKDLQVQRRDAALNGMWINKSKLLKYKGRAEGDVKHFELSIADCRLRVEDEAERVA